MGGPGKLYNQQGNDIGKIRMKLSSARLRWCWARLLESGTRWFILAIFKQSTVLGKSFMITINSVLYAQQSLRHVFIETLYKVHTAFFIKTNSVALETMLKIRV